MLTFFVSRTKCAAMPLTNRWKDDAMPTFRAVQTTALAIAAAVGLTGPALAQGATRTGALDPNVVYAGVWHEQARTPTGLTRGCEWATTTYDRDDRGRIRVLDACRQDSETGRLRTIGGVGELQDPGANATLRVRYRFGPFRPTREYRIIATDAGRSWFVSAEPGLERIYVFSREAAPPADVVQAWIERARSLGYAGPVEVLATPGRPKP
jgi:apolipoprotein D and lipocalin family protein